MAGIPNPMKIGGMLLVPFVLFSLALSALDILKYLLPFAILFVVFYCGSKIADWLENLLLFPREGSQKTEAPRIMPSKPPGWDGVKEPERCFTIVDGDGEEE